MFTADAVIFATSSGGKMRPQISVQHRNLEFPPGTLKWHASLPIFARRSCLPRSRSPPAPARRLTPRPCSPGRTPGSPSASTRQTIVNRSACGSRITRPSRLVMALSATPSSMPANTKNSVAAKYHENINSAAKATTPMPPTEIAQARSPRAETRSSTEFGNWLPVRLSGPKAHSFDKRPRDQAGKGIRPRPGRETGVWRAHQDRKGPLAPTSKRTLAVGPPILQGCGVTYAGIKC